MNTAEWKTKISVFLVAGLLALAGAFASALPASAQTQDACPRPAGVDPVDPPRVTAQQVEDGSASQMDFALAVREQSVEHSQQATNAEQGFHIGCLIRQEGGYWRSGDTYIVTLTPDGRVFVHAKDMSLSGGLLNQMTYGAILKALGIDPATLTNPAAAQAAFMSAVMGNGGQFNVGADAGYATAYFSTELRSPIVLLAGFDLDESHLVDEQVDHRQPAVTARDVVDRATLKAFVTAAGEYFVELMESGDPSAVAQAKITLRDPNGPWRHGPVYLAVLRADSKLILFHGAFPNRFEYQRGGISRDVVTGELIVDQLIGAANSGPDGGFWQYHFDDPDDDTDNADIPKVGYARVITGNIPLPDGTSAPTDFIINSGFYLSSPAVVAARQNAVVEAVLPQVMQAMTASTVDAISGRIERATSGAPQATELSFGGASTLSDAIQANGQALEDGTFDLTRLLARSSFTMQLNAAGSGSSGPFGSLTFWGSGDYRSFSGGNAQTVDYDGTVVSANLGIDTRLGANALAGMAIAQTQGTVDYTDPEAVTGEVTTSLTSINPYVGWQLGGGMNLWAAAGYGTGEVEVDDAAADTQSSDMTQQMFAVGAGGPLVSSDQLIEGGTTSLRLKGEAAFTKAEIDSSATLESMSLSASRQRLMLEGVYDQHLASGATFSPSLEVGLRNDGGDGETGTSLETGGGLRYTDPSSGLTIEGRARTVLAHSGDYEEWGVSGLVRIDPGTSGQGLGLSVQPAWGQAASGIERLWDTGVTGQASQANLASGRVNTEIGYGLGVERGLGVLTPYTGLGLAGEGAWSWRMGARWQLAADKSVGLESAWREAANDDGPEHALMLRGMLRW